MAKQERKEKRKRENASEIDYWNSLTTKERGINAPLYNKSRVRQSKNTNTDKLSNQELENILAISSPSDFLSFCTNLGRGTHAPLKQIKNNISIHEIKARKL